jgi:hypothetical protein
MTLAYLLKYPKVRQYLATSWHAIYDKVAR